MGSAEEQAVAFKNDGNKAFAAHDWVKAVELYSKAIELNDKEPTFFTNRAQVCSFSSWIANLYPSARVTYTQVSRHTSSPKHSVMPLQMPPRP